MAEVGVEAFKPICITCLTHLSRLHHSLVSLASLTCLACITHLLVSLASLTCLTYLHHLLVSLTCITYLSRSLALLASHISHLPYSYVMQHSPLAAPPHAIPMYLAPLCYMATVNPSLHFVSISMQLN